MTWPAGSPDLACKACHADDPHAVGLEPGRTTIPDDMLLLDGLLACFSCHDEPACDGHKITKDDPYFFRGGPYPSIGGLCGRCHSVTGTERFNPHRAMETEADTADLCTHCHLEVPAADAKTADLKVDGPNICLGCHIETPHAGAADHIRKVPPSWWPAVEASGLPVTAQREIVCITCHDPHPGRILARSADTAKLVGTEVLPAKWVDEVLQPALSERGEFTAQHTEPDFLRKPLHDGLLCKSCHTPDPVHPGGVR
jgi:predicted CXXCH cytochrome family protein